VGAGQYRFELSTDPTFATTVVDTTVTGVSYTPTAVLTPATQYYWRVTGINACEEGNASDVWSFTTANEICKTVSLAIPDNSAAGVSDTMTISDPSVLVGMKVAVKANHNYVGDVSFKLSNGATSVTMVDRPGFPAASFGCSGDNVDIVLDDAATQAVETQCNTSAPALSGSVKPNNAINTAFAGATLAGTWTLSATDGAAGDTGTLTGWCLIPDTGAVDDDVIFADGFEAAPEL
jgi:subtilisin-like proprotein convertase family protein